MIHGLVRDWPILKLVLQPDTAHIPEPRRGVLGPLTAETVEKLREYARRNL